MIKFILKVGLLCVVFSCNSTKSTVASSEKEVKLSKEERRLIREKKKEEERSILSQLNLDEYIYRVAGNIQVRGQGEDAKIIIRGGSTTFFAEDGPLFILDGQQIDSFAELYSAVDVADIKSLRVLKTASEIAPYGVRGTGGVIEIFTK